MRTPVVDVVGEEGRYWIQERRREGASSAVVAAAEVAAAAAAAAGFDADEDDLDEGRVEAVKVGRNDADNRRRSLYWPARIGSGRFGTETERRSEKRRTNLGQIRAKESEDLDIREELPNLYPSLHPRRRPARSKPPRTQASNFGIEPSPVRASSVASCVDDPKTKNVWILAGRKVVASRLG